MATFQGEWALTLCYIARMSLLRSCAIPHGRNTAGARAPLRAAGVVRQEIGQKPIIAVANSYTQFVPGYVQLKPVGDVVSAAITGAGGIPRDFNTIVVEDGIAYPKARGLGKVCALAIDGQFSGTTSSLSLGHVSPERAAGRRARTSRTGRRDHH